MKTIFLMIGGFLFSLIGATENPTAPAKIKSTSPVVIKRIIITDEQPVLMHGHVKRPGGLALPGASVSLRKIGETLPSFSGTSDENGDYTFSSVGQGEYELRLAATTYVTKFAGVTVSTDFSRTDTLVSQ